MHMSCEPCIADEQKSTLRADRKRPPLRKSQVANCQYLANAPASVSATMTAAILALNGLVSYPLLPDWQQ
jgi:hypothetical protein